MTEVIIKKLKWIITIKTYIIIIKFLKIVIIMQIIKWMKKKIIELMRVL